MREKVPSPNELELTPEQIRRFWNFIIGDDIDFYEEHILHLSNEEQRKFFEDNPGFMSEFLSNHDRIDLLKDEVYRGILRKIKEYEGGKSMALIKCPECGKEISDKAGSCPHCGCPVNIKTEWVNENNTREIFKQKNRKTLYIGLGIIIVITMIFVIFKFLNQNSKEYCEGLKWGTSIKALEKKYPDWTYSDESDNYFELVESLDGFSSDGQMIDMNFYFDDKDQLYKIEADIVGEDLDDAILYFVNYFNKIYDEDYEASYDTEYKWLGDDTNVSMTAYSAILNITYEEAK